MLLIGKHITAPSDPLQPVSVQNVFKAICNARGEVATLQNRLRAIRIIDAGQYRKMKTTLPYIVCASFQPNVRKKENFVFTERFIVDIDHLSEYEIDMKTLRQKLRDDPRVELLFSSPGGDGLKVLFVLSERMTDSGYYALFYKSFCMEFAGRYELRGAVDTKTNDVSRCCFVSFDPDAYYNSSADKVNAAQYLPEEGAFNFDKLKNEIREQERENRKEQKDLGIDDAVSAPLSDDILTQIKKKVGVRVKQRVEKSYIQPEQLDKIMPEVIQQLEEIGAGVVKMSPIDYGRQLRVGAGSYWAEINLFYGKRGVRVVGTTKTGSNKQLCESVLTLLQSHFDNNIY